MRIRLTSSFRQLHDASQPLGRITTTRYSYCPCCW
jgi:hypothetical protein